MICDVKQATTGGVRDCPNPVTGFLVHGDTRRPMCTTHLELFGKEQAIARLGWRVIPVGPVEPPPAPTATPD